MAQQVCGKINDELENLLRTVRAHSDLIRSGLCVGKYAEAHIIERLPEELIFTCVSSGQSYKTNCLGTKFKMPINTLMLMYSICNHNRKDQKGI